MLGLSLFSGAGIGDIGFHAAGVEFIAMCELEEDRLNLAKTNFPNLATFQGDIWQLKDEIVKHCFDELARRGKELDLISCTAPCQGMSKNGQGTLLKNIREGKRPSMDPRNRLILPALQIIKNLKPKIVVFENVTEMRRTLIEDEFGKIMPILDIIKRSLGDDYHGEAYEVEFANYGIPQRRSRLITVYSKEKEHKVIMLKGGKLIPPETHSKSPDRGKKKWVTVLDAIKNFPPLDAKNKKFAQDASVPFHKVPVLDEDKYFWVSNTPPGKSAFDNQCIKCGFTDNVAHSTKHDSEGINRASKTTPLYCEKCGVLLPRPSAKNPDGSLRIMSGFTSAYKRMAPDLPAPALTRNFSYACSDQKIHPYQNRVLSIAEALKIHTLSDYSYLWEIEKSSGKRVLASDALIRMVIGESIPPRFLEILMKYLVMSKADPAAAALSHIVQPTLFKPELQV